MTRDERRAFLKVPETFVKKTVQQDQEELSFPDDVIRSSDTGVSELGST